MAYRILDAFLFDFGWAGRIGLVWMYTASHTKHKNRRHLKQKTASDEIFPDTLFMMTQIHNREKVDFYHLSHLFGRSIGQCA